MPDRVNDTFGALAAKLQSLLDDDPLEAVRQARLLQPVSSDGMGTAALRASLLVDGGAASRQQDAIEEGLALFRRIHERDGCSDNGYNLANAITAAVGPPPGSSDWLDHQERTRDSRAEARRLYWSVGQDEDASSELRTQAMTNLANQLSRSYRLGEAHDGRLDALRIDPTNGVAAGIAARELLWIYAQGGCSDLTRVEAVLLAKVAQQNLGRVKAYAGANVARQLYELANELCDPPPRSPHADPFIQWVERERLTLAPAVERVDPELGKIDWLMLDAILERDPAAAAGMPPPVFAMFNVLKADFILARDLAWRALQEGAWPDTGRFASTLDYAAYGPHVSALIMAHRGALDLLDKIAVTANHYFEIGQPPNRVYFGKLWRTPATKKAPSTLAPPVVTAINHGAYALYGLVELAEDYDREDGILRLQKDLRNAGTHRFVVLHELGDPEDFRAAAEIEHHDQERFTEDVLKALRIARSAIQALALAITQHEKGLRDERDGPIPSFLVPDHI
jgi:hypothetical protein